MNPNFFSNISKHLRLSRGDEQTSGGNSRSVAPAFSHVQAQAEFAHEVAPRQLLRSLLHSEDAFEVAKPAESERAKGKKAQTKPSFVLHAEVALKRPSVPISRSQSTPNLLASVSRQGRASMVGESQMHRASSARRWSSDKAFHSPLVIDTDGERPGSTRYMRPSPPADKSGEPRLPNRNFAVYKHDKLDNYVLNSAHIVGSGHGKPLATIGYERVPVWELRNPYVGRRWAAAHPSYQASKHELIEQLQSNLERYPAHPGKDDLHGRRFGVDMQIEGPTGESVEMKTKWIDKPAETSSNFFRNRPEFDTAWKLSTKEKAKNEQK